MCNSLTTVVYNLLQINYYYMPATPGIYFSVMNLNTTIELS